MNELDNSPSMNAQTSVDQLSFEAAFLELEEIVNSLEQNSQSLEETLAKFERGQALARHCAKILDQAELKIQQLSEGALADFTPGV